MYYTYVAVNHARIFRRAKHERKNYYILIKKATKTYKAQESSGRFGKIKMNIKRPGHTMLNQYHTIQR